MVALTAATVVAQLFDTASAVPPAIASGTAIPIDADDWIVKLQFGAAVTVADATKLVVNVTRPGYNATIGGAAITRPDVAYGQRQVRRSYPNQTSVLPAGANALYMVLDNCIRASDVVTSITLLNGFYTGQTADETITTAAITRFDTQAYEKPIVRPVTVPYRYLGPTGSLDVEFSVVHEWAAFGSQVARVEARAKVGATYGPWTGTSAMVRSVSTPATGRLPGLPVDVYRVTLDVTGLPDSSAGVVTGIAYRAYGWYGDVIFDSEVDGTPHSQSLNSPTLLPFILDRAGNHSRIYAWVNRNGVAGASAAIQTSSTTDPGEAGSYASEAAAFTAARAWNNTAGNRPTPHNTTSGIMILYRDVPGSTALGDSTTSYFQRANMSGAFDGLRPPVLSSASYLTTGVPTLACRRRGVQDDGTTVAPSKLWNGTIEVQGITFDGTGLTGAAHAIMDGQFNGAANSAAAATSNMIRRDCDLRENSNAGSAFPAFTRYGWLYNIRFNDGGLGANDGPGSAAASATSPQFFAGIVTDVGSAYTKAGTNVTAALLVGGLFGCRLTNMYLASQAAGPQPDLEWQILYNVRADFLNATNNMTSITGARPIRKGAGICNFFVRSIGSANPAMVIANDTTTKEINNVVVQHWGADGGVNDGSARLNMGYNDAMYLGIRKRLSLKYAAIISFNTKADTFNSPDGVYTTPWATGVAQVRGNLVTDGGTPAVYYQSLGDFTTGATQATDLADTTRWFQIGQVSAVPGRQPLRTGNWRFRNGVRNFGNVSVQTALEGAITGREIDPDSSYGDALPRGSKFHATYATLWKRPSATLADLGDYRPQSIASGDAADSDLLGRVAAGMGVTPSDLNGNPRRNDGGGAAGPYERADVNALLNVNAGAIAVAGAVATLIAAATLSPAAATVAMSGSSSALVGAATMVASPATIALTGGPATVKASAVMAAAASTIAFSGSAAVLTVGGGGVTMTPAAATIAVTGSAATIVASARLAVDAGVIQVVSDVAELEVSTILTPAAGRMALFGSSVTLANYAPARPPAGRVVIVPAI